MGSPGYHTETLAAPDAFVQRGCLGKKPYPSKRQATGANRVWAARGADSLDVYRCRACKHWHLGHNRRRRVRPAAPQESAHV